MDQSENRNIPYPGFFKDLLNRRVPQLVGFYIAGSWGVLQFLDWIVGRYLLSPLLVDMALTIIGALLPSIIILAYCHGSPGKNMWQRSEKILIPINLVLTVILVFTLFNHKNLDSIARRVAVTDESGEMIEKIVPKSGLIKELAVFYFKNLSEKKNLDWLKYGLVNMLEFDLSQDPFVNTKSPSTNNAINGFYIYSKFKDAGYPEVTNAPLMLQKKIAEDINSPYFLSGSITKVENLFELTVTIYLTKNTKTVSKIVIKEKSVFSLIDELSVFVKKSLKLPSYKNDEIVDLQIKDIYTDSEKAAKLAVLAFIEIIKNNNWKAALQYLEEALKEDKTFTWAYMNLAEIYAMNNNMEKWKSTYRTMMKYLYKLPDKMQFHLKAGYYIVIKGEPEKAISLLKMLTKLYPTDIENYLSLALRLDLTGNYDEAILYYKKILEISPDRFDLFNEIGKAYENKSDPKNALIYFKMYADKFPKKPEGFLKIGEVEELLGNFEKAGKYYEKALLLEPEKISTTLLIAGLDIKSGKYRKALEMYSELLASAKNPRQRSSIYSDLIGYYKLRGQPGKELEYTELMLENSKKFRPPFTILITRIVLMDVYIKNGKQDQVKKMLDSFKEKLTSPFDKLVSLGYIFYYMDRGDLDKAETYIGDLEDFVKKTGTKQFLFFVHKKKGDIFRLRHLYDKALVHYKKALEHNRNNLTVLNHIAFCYREQEKFDESLNYIKKALNISPYHPKINYHASRLYFAMENRELGLRHLKRALVVWEEAEPIFIPAKEAKELMKKYSLGGANGN